MNNPSTERKTRILVVLDDPMLLGLVSSTLRPEGHEVLIVGNLIEALSFTGQEFQRIDLVITRINNKPISGLEFSKRLIKREIDVPILFMSTSHSLAGVIANSLGPSAVLEEPFTAAALRTSVRRCLAGRRRRTDQSPGETLTA